MFKSDHLWKPPLSEPLKTYHLKNLGSWEPLPSVIRRHNFIHFWHIFYSLWLVIGKHNYKLFWHLTFIIWPVIGRQVEPDNLQHFWDHRHIHLLADHHIVAITVEYYQTMQAGRSPSGQAAVEEAGVLCWLQAGVAPNQSPPLCQILAGGFSFFKNAMK